MYIVSLSPSAVSCKAYHFVHFEIPYIRNVLWASLSLSLDTILSSHLSLFCLTTVAQWQQEALACWLVSPSGKIPRECWQRGQIFNKSGSPWLPADEESHFSLLSLFLLFTSPSLCNSQLFPISQSVLLFTPPTSFCNLLHMHITCRLHMHNNAVH